MKTKTTSQMAKNRHVDDQDPESARHSCTKKKTKTRLISQQTRSEKEKETKMTTVRLIDYKNR